MTDKQGIFFDEWQACLRAHYTYVIRVNDTGTEATLRGVLLQTGLTEGDLDDMHAVAEELGPLAEEDVSPVSATG